MINFDSFPKSTQSVVYAFLSDIVPQLKGDLKEPKVFVLDLPLPELNEFAKERKAKRWTATLPFDGVEFLSHMESTARTLTIKKISAEGLWTFESSDKAENVTVGNLLFLHSDYEEANWSCVSFLVAASRERADAFLHGYYRAKWERNQGPKVLNHYGHEIESFRKMQWKDIFLPNNQGETIHSEIETFFKSEAKYKEHGLDWKRGIMLAGKPGNGKTAICRAIATTCSVPVVYCALDDSDTFRVLSRVDKTIRANSPCVVIFEDADSLASNPQARSTILNLLDGLLSVPGVFTVASTNMPDKLDEAFTGRPSRFDSFHVIGDPPPVERRKIFEARLGAMCSSLPGPDVEELIRKMDGLSAASVQEVAVCALLESFKTDKQVDIAMLQEAFAKVKKHMKTSDQGMSKLLRGSIGFGNTNSKDHDYDDF